MSNMTVWEFRKLVEQAIPLEVALGVLAAVIASIVLYILCMDDNNGF